MSDPSSWNRYAYVEGDPVNNIDPEGLFLSVADLVQQTKARATPRLDTATCTYGGMTYPAWMMICRVMPLLIGPELSSPQTSDDVERLVNLSTTDILMRELPLTIQYATSLLSKPGCRSLFSGEDPSAVLTAMMGSIGRDGLLTDSRIYFRNLTMNDRDRVAQTVVGGASSPATGGNGFAGNTWANAVIELDIDSWRGMSGLEQARTLIHELGHMYQLVTGLGSSAFEYDVGADGRPDSAIGARNRARELQCW